MAGQLLGEIVYGRTAKRSLVAINRMAEQVLMAARRARAAYRLHARTAAAMAVLSSRKPPYRLHLGCGAVKLQGWINVDFDGAPDICWDITTPFPLRDESCELIYHEHVLEHLAVEQGLSLLRDCRRLLQPGGVMRIAMPNLEDLVEYYRNERWREQEWVRWPAFNVATRCEFLNRALREWGHQWVYDREELHRRLHEIGFSKVHDVGWHESEIPALRNLETRKESTLICEMVKN